MILKRLLGLLFCLLLIGSLSPSISQAAGIPLEIADIGTLSLPGNLDIQPAKDTDTAAGIGAQYDLICLANDTWHYARLIIFKDSRDLGLAANMFNQGIQNPQVLNVISSGAKDMLEKSMNKNGAHLLEWYPPKAAAAGKHNAIALAFRCTATDKLPMPLYANMYFFVPDRSLVGLALLCADSDRKYWESIFKDAVTKME